MGEAFRIAKTDMESDKQRIQLLRDKLWDGLKDIEEVYLNGDEEHRAAGFLNVSFNGTLESSLEDAIFTLTEVLKKKYRKED